MSRSHRTILMRLPCGPVHIDRGIAPLIRLCWAAGLRTRHCCQGNPIGRRPDALERRAYISFENAESAMAFHAASGRASWAAADSLRAIHEYGEWFEILWWCVEDDTVRFPCEDTGRARTSLQRNLATVPALLKRLRAMRGA